MQRMLALIAVVGFFNRRRRDTPKSRERGGAFILCPACEKELHNTLTRCPYCSAFLSITCSNCDRTSNRGLGKCPYCGTPFRGDD